MKRRVCVVQYRLLHYRLELFERLKQACALRDLDLVLVHGQPTPTEALRNDTGTLPWAHAVRNKVWRFRGRDFLWQPLPAEARESDLIVFMQESRLISNYPWLFGWGPHGTRVAYWGHGRNFQSEAPQGLRERWKQRMIRSVDWWFAYTQMSADIVAQSGFPKQRITLLNNAIDNSNFESELASVSDAEVQQLRGSIGAAPDAVVGLYCGSLYSDKRLDLLVAAGRLIHAQHPTFRMVVIGDGPSRPLIEAALKEPWLSWQGVRRGREKAAWFRASQLYLSPGAVGLHVLDSFVAGTPMITTADALHGPEIAYLENGVNGVVTPGDAASYAAAVLALIDQPAQADALRARARESAEQYTLQAMVERFADGLAACVAAPRLR